MAERYAQKTPRSIAEALGWPQRPTTGPWKKKKANAASASASAPDTATLAPPSPSTEINFQVDTSSLSGAYRKNFMDTHFEPTNKRVVTKQGRESAVSLVKCVYCVRREAYGQEPDLPITDMYAAAVGLSNIEPFKGAQEITRRFRDCWNHLKTCTQFRKSGASLGHHDVSATRKVLPLARSEVDMVSSPVPVARKRAFEGGQDDTLSSIDFKADKESFSQQDRKDFMEEHFARTAKKVVTKQGKVSPIGLVKCIYCLRREIYGDEPGHPSTNHFGRSNDKPFYAQEITRRFRDCWNHLKNCPQYRKGTPAGGDVGIHTLDSPMAFASNEASTFPPVARAPAQVARKNVIKREHGAMRANGSNKFEELLIEFLIDNSLSFDLVERESFHRLMDSARPNLSNSIPNRTQCATTLLDKFANAAIEKHHGSLQEEINSGHLVGCVVDSSQNRSGTHIEGVILRAGDVSIAWEPSVSDLDHHAIAIARDWEQMFDDLKEKRGYTVSFHVSDNAGESARARRILALRHPQMMWMCCWARQVNLMVKALLLKSEFKTVLDDCSKIVNTLNASDKNWLPKLRETCARMYGEKCVTLSPLCETGWNSTQMCFASLLRISSALKTFVQTCGSDEASDDFPEILHSATDDFFWLKVQEAELLVRPLCDASFLLKRETGNTIAHVVHALLKTYRGIDSCATVGLDESVLPRYMLTDVERRWARAEHPLFFLAFVLHPHFRDVGLKMIEISSKKRGSWSMQKNPLSVFRLTEAAELYYRKYELCSEDGDVNEECKRLRADMYAYLSRGYKLARALDVRPLLSTTNNNVARCWRYMIVEGGPTARLAAFLLDCPIQSATCEDLFKCLGRDERDRSHGSSAYKQTIMKHHLRAKYKKIHETNGVRERGTDTKYRIESTTEHARVEDGDDAGSSTSGHTSSHPLADANHQQNETLTNDTNSQEDKMETNLKDSNDDEASDDGHAGSAIRKPGETVAEFWCRALESIEDDCEFVAEAAWEEDKEEEERMAAIANVLRRTSAGRATPTRETEPTMMREESDDETNFMANVPMRPIDIEALPTENIATYPQEDAAYLAKEGSARNDKYTLKDLCSGLDDEDLPDL